MQYTSAIVYKTYVILIDWRVQFSLANSLMNSPYGMYYIFKAVGLWVFQVLRRFVKIIVAYESKIKHGKAQLQ